MRQAGHRVSLALWIKEEMPHHRFGRIEFVGVANVGNQPDIAPISLVGIDAVAIAILHTNRRIVGIEAEQLVVGRCAVQHMPSFFWRAQHSRDALQNLVIIDEQMRGGALCVGTVLVILDVGGGAGIGIAGVMHHHKTHAGRHGQTGTTFGRLGQIARRDGIFHQEAHD